MTSKNHKLVFIDATTFLGLHSTNDIDRENSLEFFTGHFESRIHMSLEQVGKCDEIIWRYSRKQQDLYYPFMDRLHTDMDIRRLAYTYNDLFVATNNEVLRTLSPTRALLVAQVINHDGIIYTHDTEISNLQKLKTHVGVFSKTINKPFNPEMKNYYQISQAIKISPERINYV